MALTNCKRCETPNPDSARFCGTCGEPISPSAAAVPRTSAPPPSFSSSLAGTRTQAPPTPGQVMPGTPFGTRYLLLQRLGRGGMGEVWKARDLELDHLVALKMIRPDLLQDADLLERFKHEITLARKVTHRNVTRIHDLGEVEGTRFISMEYLEGKNLKEFIEAEGPLPEEKAIPIIRGICEGLSAAHDAGVVHRDLKPQNVLIDHDGHPHIMDFGIAFSGETAGLTRTGALIGTPEYMSPEQVRGERLDVRSDIYSLGLIFYEMVTKDLPFTADSVASSMYKRLSERPRRPRELRQEIPPFLEKIILRCLEKERAFRYADVGEILADIRTKHAPGFTPQYVASLVRQKAALFSAVALLILLGVTVAILFQRRILSFGRGGAAPAGRAATSVAVFPFQNSTGEAKMDWFRTGLSNLLTTDLAQARGIRVVSPARLSQTLNDLHLADLRSFDPATLQSVAGFLDAQTILTGSYTVLGDTIRVDAQVFRIEGKEAVPVAPFKAEAKGEHQIFAMVDDLARQVRETMGAASREVLAERPRALRQVITGSIPAMKEYTGALDRLHRGGYLEAAEGFRKAVAIDPAFAMAHARLGEAYRALGRDAEALRSLDEAVAHLDRVSEREAFVIKALQASLKHDTETAIKNYEAMVKQFPNDPESYFNLASTYEQASKYDPAIANYQKAIQGDEKYAPAYYGLGRALFTKGDYPGALKNFTALLAIQGELKNEDGKATALNGLGAVYYEMGRDAEAIQHYQQSADLKKRLGDLTGYGRSLSNMARTYRRSGRLEEAILTAQQALAVRRQVGDRRGECSDLESLGTIYYDGGRYEESLKAHQDSLRIAQEIKNDPLVAANLGNIGAIYFDQGRYAEAEIFYRQAAEKRREIGNNDGIVRSLLDIGRLEFVLGRPNQALARNLEAMKIARQIQDDNAVAALSINLGALYMDQGRYRAARQAYEEALTLLRASGDQTTLAEALKDSADLDGRVGRFTEADSALQEAEKIGRAVGNEVLIGEILTTRGELSLRRGSPRDAGADLRKAADLLAKRKNLAAVLRARVCLGIQALQTASQAALSLTSRVAREAGELGNVPLMVQAQVADARAAWLAKKYAQAEESAGTAIRQGSVSGSAEPLFQAYLIRGLGRLSLGRRGEAASDLVQAVGILDRIQEDLADPALSSAFRSRPDLRPALAQLARALGEAGKAAEAEKISSWTR